MKIDRSGSLSFAIRGVPSSIRPPNRHSGEGRNPEGEGSGECSAGACPPLGKGWGVAESTVPIQCTKPQLRLFIPWCAGTNRHGRLVRKHVPDYDPG